MSELVAAESKPTEPFPLQGSDSATPAASAAISPPLSIRTRRRIRLTLRPWVITYALPLFLLAASIITTAAIGARYMQNFLIGGPTIANESDLWPWPWLLEHPSRLHLGWSFSATLLGILLAHEFGHYIACRLHGIRATLPWVLPAPTLSGTIGAVIQIRSRIPSRRALIDVGIYGPIAGFVASLIAATAGLLLSRPVPVDSTHELISFAQPLAIRLLHEALSAFHPGVAGFEIATRHPALIAAWVGLFITSLNLIPAGQLDGGHILYAISPRWHRRLTRIMPVVLGVCGVFFWVGWALWGLMLLIPALRHPRVQNDQPLEGPRRWLPWLALAIFLLTFSASPFAGSSVLHYLRPGY